MVGGRDRIDAANLPTAGRIEQWRREAEKEGYRDGHAKGMEEGRVAARQELADSIEVVNRIRATLAEPLRELDREVEQQLAQLALVLAQQIIRRELKTDPGQVVAVIRESLPLLPAGARHVRVRLHPDDAALVREALGLDEATEGWKVVDDPTVARGGCEIHSEFSHIDATIEKQLNGLAAGLLGDERERER